MVPHGVFAPYLERWNLTPDGEAFTSLSGTLLPVRQQGVAAMLKVSHGKQRAAQRSEGLAVGRELPTCQVRREHALRDH